jgi:hypothetical protein
MPMMEFIHEMRVRDVRLRTGYASLFEIGPVLISVAHSDHFAAGVIVRFRTTLAPTDVHS